MGHGLEDTRDQDDNMPAEDTKVGGDMGGQQNSNPGEGVVLVEDTPLYQVVEEARVCHEEEVAFPLDYDRRKSFRRGNLWREEVPVLRKPPRDSS